VFDPAVYDCRSTRLIDQALSAEDTSGLVAPITRTSVRGGATAAILDAARDAQLLALGSRGLGGVKSMLLGSVTLQAAHHAPCPLVVIPPTP
jgi:nucleotide-binding universal stress UspA family protein